jgi:pimeloyl-ACP methyl ester carboxylesterase
VHGGFHGAWCWDLLIPELEALGHRAAAVDLPIEQVGAGPDRYAALVAERLAALQQPVWLVGHSMGGIVIPRVRPLDGVAGLIYLCPGLPARNAGEHEENLAAFVPGLTDAFDIDDEGMITMSAEDAAARMYSDTPVALREWAIPRLRRQWSGAIVTELTPFAGYPDLPRHVILAEDDRILALPRIAAIARRRLGVEPIVQPGDHSPFVSRPHELAALLHRLVASPTSTVAAT